MSAPPSPSTSAAPRSPPASSTPTANCCHHAQLPTPDGRRAGGLGRRRALLTEALAAAGRRGRGASASGPRAHRPADRHDQPHQHRCVATLSDRRKAQRPAPDCPCVSAATGCAWHGERWHGAGRGAHFMLGMVVSTGIGGGLVLDGAPYDGRTGNAGHVGHVVVEPDGELCTCGGRGCVETVAAGPHLARWAHETGGARRRTPTPRNSPTPPPRVTRSRCRPSRGATGALASDDRVGGGGCATSTWWSSAGASRSPGALLFDPLRASAHTLRRAWTSSAVCAWCPPSSVGTAGLVGAAASSTPEPPACWLDRDWLAAILGAVPPKTVGHRAIG